MRTIDIIVSSPSDVQKESAVAEQLIRSVATEFNLPINVSYSNPLRGSKEENEIRVERKNFGDESTLVLCPCFWEYPALEGDHFQEQIPNTGQYDLVVCILWSRLGTALIEKCVMPDGGRPRSATDYEVGWVLDQSKRTPGFPALHVYRNRGTPAAPLEPKEKRANLCRQWDEVQEFCAAWEKNSETEFRECCHDYQELEEFENLFREHFRDFLARHLDRKIGLRKALRKVHHLESNPFRGLNFFDFEHAPLYHGRTKAVWEVLDALKNQATAKKPFVLVLGPTGSGKSSLVRAGVLPLVTQGGTPVGNGPWRHAVTRPGVGGGAEDPFESLAAALLAKSALAELQDIASPVEGRNLAFQLREDPDGAAIRITEVLDQLTRYELDRPVVRLAPRPEHFKVAIIPKRLGRVKPEMRLALVVDQLEELFTGVSLALQRKYIAALCALARCGRVFIIATLRSDFYAHYQKFPELVEITASGGRYELQPPTPRGIGNMIRFPADAAGLRFERDPDTSRNLDEALLEAAIASPEPLPLLEHLLSRLYQRQLDRKDGLLLWSDYRGMGEFQGALAQHTETLFSTLNSDEQRALKFVIRHLVAPGRSEEGPAIRRTVPYRDLVSSPELNQGERAGAKDLVDHLIKEGLLSAEADPKQWLLISIPQEALLRRWPGVWQWISEDRHFFRMRHQLETSLELWLSGGRRSDDLLGRGMGLAEAETLLRDFGSSLSEAQIDYIQKSLARQKRRRRAWDSIGLAIAGLAVFAAVAAVERFNTESRRKNREQDVQQTPQNADLATNRQSALEIQLKNEQVKLQEVQANAERTASQLSELEAQLRHEQERAQIAQANADFATSQKSALEAQLKNEQVKLQEVQANTERTASQLSESKAQLSQEQEKAQKAQASADFAANQQSALETQLKKAEEKVQLAQQNADLAANRQNALETQLKNEQVKLQEVQPNAERTASQLSELEAQLSQEQEKAQKAQANADFAANQQSALETQLKNEQMKLQEVQANAERTASQLSESKAQLSQEQERAQKAQANADFATSQRSALEIQLKEAEKKVQLAQQNADLATNRQSALEAQLKNEQVKLQEVQANAERAASQLGELEAQLSQEQERAQKAQANADFATSQRSALEIQLKEAEKKVQLAQQNADLATNRQSALETQLKNEQMKLQEVQPNAERTASQLSELEAQLSQEQEKAQKAQANADFATSQQSALETQLKEAEKKVQLAQQNADLATNRQSALEAQLKNEQVKLQEVQANAELTASQLGELEAQLSQEQERAQKAQANADSAIGELRRMQHRVTTPLRPLTIQPAINDRNSASGIGADATFAWFMIGVNPEQKQNGLQWGKYPQLNPPQDVSPKPSPSTKESETSNPPESQLARSAEASGEEERLKEFVLGYLRTVASNDTSIQRRYFAARVNFYGRGVLNSSSIEASTQQYHNEWPIREWAPRRQAKVVRSRNPNLFVVYQPFEWTVSDGSLNQHGNATLVLRVRKNSQGEFQIVHVHQLDR